MGHRLSFSLHHYACCLWHEQNLVLVSTLWAGVGHCAIDLQTSREGLLSSSAASVVLSCWRWLSWGKAHCSYVWAPALGLSVLLGHSVLPFTICQAPVGARHWEYKEGLQHILIIISWKTLKRVQYHVRNVEAGRGSRHVAKEESHGACEWVSRDMGPRPKCASYRQEGYMKVRIIKTIFISGLTLWHSSLRWGHK